ncbi:HERV-H LTR-associating protein 2 [Rhinichthys klamathensis goyatoka]|uniref:HERV-H LTR-associating protein 2 n=1 Tax=Rhinichthys klamathensis goyatoka TaxID=3034132 RepID=UPI0024B51271|nr:HERV-H LTR-associating protein 2 [Rhinichthys klamathensis goyatoka]
MKLVILLWILPVTLGDIHVTCMYSAECLLPCTSTILDIIHWYKDSKPVHSFYYNQDQLGHQSEDYKGRTSLLPQSEIKNGNVSLLLKNIRVQDEGRYRCYTANEKTNDEKFVSVSVEAPVKSVDITLKNDTVTCKTSGVYPKPDVSWSSEPLANESLNTFQETEEKLFMVTSELKVGVIGSTYKYTCSITSKDRTKTATLEEPGLETVEKLTGSVRAGIIAGIVAIAIVIAIAICVVIKKKRHKYQRGNTTRNNR